MFMCIVCVFICVHISVYSCALYVYLCVCKCVHAHTHTHTHAHQMGMNVLQRHQRTNQDVLFSLFPPYSFETGLLTEPGTRLVASKPQPLPVSALHSARGYRHISHTQLLIWMLEV